METVKDEFGKTLEAHAPEFGIALQADRLERLIDYYGLIMKWNERLHLVAPCSPADFVTRRALDRFSEILPALVDWAPRNSTLLLFAGESIRNQIQTILSSVTVERIPHSERRFLLIARATN